MEILKNKVRRATPMLSQAVTSRGRSGYRYVILDAVMDQRPERGQKATRRRRGLAVMRGLLEGRSSWGGGESRTSGRPDWPGPG